MNDLESKFLKINWTPGGYVNKSTGAITPYDSWSYSDFIQLTEYNFVKRIWSQQSEYNAVYDINKNYLRSFTVPEGESISDVLASAVYIRFSIRTSQVNNCKVQLLPFIEDRLDINQKYYNATTIKLRQFHESYQLVSNGITYTALYNTVSAQGTATSTSAFKLFWYQKDSSNSERQDDISWMKENHTYYMGIQKQGTNIDDLRINLRTFIGNEEVNNYDFYSSGTFKLHRISEIDWVEIRVIVSKDQYVNGSITYALLESPPLQYIVTNQQESTSTPIITGDGSLKLRILQNNIGCFRYGRLPGTAPNEEDAYKYYEHTTEELNRVILNYKRFLGDIKPDVVCLQEYVKYMGANNTHEASVDLLSPLFHYKQYNSSKTDKQRTIWTNISSTFNTVTFNHNSKSDTFELAKLNIKDDVYVATLAFHPQSGTAGVTYRRNQYTAILNILDEYPNVILAADLNVYSDEELTDIIDLAKSYGWHSFNMGDYWGRYNTYINPPNQASPNHYYRMIDGIWCKGSMKMVNSKVLFEESTYYPDTYVWDPADVTTEKPNVMVANQYNLLASDHVPVIADIVIY